MESCKWMGSEAWLVGNGSLSSKLFPPSCYQSQPTLSFQIFLTVLHSSMKGNGLLSYIASQWMLVHLPKPTFLGNNSVPYSLIGKSICTLWSISVVPPLYIVSVSSYQVSSKGWVILTWLLKQCKYVGVWKRGHLNKNYLLKCRSAPPYAIGKIQ